MPSGRLAICETTLRILRVGYFAERIRELANQIVLSGSHRREKASHHRWRRSAALGGRAIAPSGEHAEIVIFERGAFVSFAIAACLPRGDVITTSESCWWPPGIAA